jgi:hypothetical protein
MPGLELRNLGLGPGMNAAGLGRALGDPLGRVLVDEAGLDRELEPAAQGLDPCVAGKGFQPRQHAADDMTLGEAPDWITADPLADLLKFAPLGRARALGECLEAGIAVIGLDRRRNAARGRAAGAGGAMRRDCRLICRHEFR